MRLIDANELKKKLKAERCDCEVIQIIDDMPTAAEPVKHGHWISEGRDYRCSECTIAAPISVYTMTRIKSQYCSYCGAKMGGESE